MKNIKYLLLFLFISSLFIETSSLPRFALRGSSTCGDCQINPPGGKMRISRGWNVGKKYLPMRTTDDDFEMSNKLNENISFGLDFRGNLLAVMDSSFKRIDFQRMAGTIYTDVELSDEID